MPLLEIKTGPLAGKKIPLEGSVTLGRGSSADIDLADRSVSRKHAVIAPKNGAWLLTDLSTPNGTFVEGARVGEPIVLKDGSTLQFGTVEARFEGTSAVPAAAIQEDRGTGSIIMRMPAAGPSGAEAPSSLRLQFLSELGGLLGHTFDEEALLLRILDKLLELLPQAERGSILLKDDGEGSLTPRVARSRDPKAGPVTTSRTLLREVMEKREGILSADALEDKRFSTAGSMFDVGIRSLMCAPILDEGAVYGVIHVDSTRPGFPFGADDMQLLLAVAHLLALALANVRLHSRLLEQELMRHDLALAGKVQQRFLPKEIPSVPGCGIAVEYTPAQEVGGDFYAFLDLEGGRVGLALGDVSGKGVSAALCMARIMSDLRYLAVGQTEPGEILRRLNVSLSGDLDEGMFVTMVLMILEPRSAELKVARAGHPPPLVCEGDGDVVTLAAGDGPALAVDPSAEFSQRQYTLDRQDVVVIYSDGVTEALDPKKGLYGEERLAKAISKAPRSARGVRQAILDDLQTFVRGEPQSDDLTLVCLDLGR
jgi:sigma-B regulation protein RsbU (phosphoserine phosphatase)